MLKFLVLVQVSAVGEEEHSFQCQGRMRPHHEVQNRVNENVHALLVSGEMQAVWLALVTLPEPLGC